MKTIILAAGYGTRMRGVIGDRPKALIEVGGKTILDHLLANLRNRCHEDDIVLVTNARYHDHFAVWQQQSGSRIVLLNDGSTHLDNRLGAVGDIRFAMTQAGIAGDTVITAADNVFAFSFDGLLHQFAKTGRRAAQVGIWHNPDLEDQKRRGVVEMEADGRLAAFTEKPANPASHWAAAPLYLLPAALLEAVNEFIESGGNADAPGYFIEYLVGRHPVYGWRMPGDILDVGNPESLARALRALGE